MNRTEKAEFVEDLKAKFTKANAAFVAEFRGMTVESLTDLRRKVRAGNGELKIIKNRLAKIATQGSQFENMKDEFRGPVGIVFSYKDPVAVAKALLESLSDASPLKLRSGNLNGKLMDEKSVVALSKLPDQKTLLAMMLRAIQGPLSGFVTVLAANPRGLLNALTAVKAQKEKQ